ncbi:MAG TPA: diguanylate cyclase [Terracidiphilus sp.]|nr:diguanylate cyclase [Terracidiphilus sp.]
MSVAFQPKVLLASHHPALLSATERALASAGVKVQVVLSAEAARETMLAATQPDLVLLDAELPGMEIGSLLAGVRAGSVDRRAQIVLFSDSVSDECMHWLAGGLLDDLIPRDPNSAHWPLRLQMALRACKNMHELESLREAAALATQADPLTGVLNRGALLSMLFRETDRAQRMKTPLCLLLFDVDDFGHWNSELGTEACDDLLCQVAGRATRLMRSYDLLGRAGKDEFLLVLPGCSVADATILAERLRMEVFAQPFLVPGHAIRLSACFGIAASEGRSPVVVLREAEMALHKARNAGAESIHCFGEISQSDSASVAFLSPAREDDPRDW